jgi:hypothetical protein
MILYAGGFLVQITEIKNGNKKIGKNIAEYEADKKVVRLTKTYNNKNTFDDLLFVIACRRLAEHTAKPPILPYLT